MISYCRRRSDKEEEALHLEIYKLEIENRKHLNRIFELEHGTGDRRKSDTHTIIMVILTNIMQFLLTYYLTR